MTKAEYEKKCPMDGPAKKYEVIAARIRAGENEADVLADYGFYQQRQEELAFCSGCKYKYLESFVVSARCKSCNKGITYCRKCHKFITHMQKTCITQSRFIYMFSCSENCTNILKTLPIIK